MKLLKRDNGFTLIEILVVVSIIGILAAIAMVTLWTQVRSSTFCSSIEADMHNLTIVQEAYYADNDTYLAITAAPPGGGAAIAQPGATASNAPNFFLSPGVTLANAAGDANGWTVDASHPSCIDSPYTYTQDGRQ